MQTWDSLCAGWLQWHTQIPPVPSSALTLTVAGQMPIFNSHAHCPDTGISGPKKPTHFSIPNTPIAALTQPVITSVQSLLRISIPLFHMGKIIKSCNNHLQVLQCNHIPTFCYSPILKGLIPAAFTTECLHWSKKHVSPLQPRLIFFWETSSHGHNAKATPSKALSTAADVNSTFPP